MHMSPNATITPGDYNRELPVAGKSRSYLVLVPPQYNDSPMPVVLAFHGGATNGEAMARFCGLSEKADEAGFICVYPNGTGRLRRVLTWNGGNCCGYAKENQIDDVGFVRALLADMARE